MILRTVAFNLILFLVVSAAVVAAQECGPKPRLITVEGTSEIKLPPDQVTLSLGVESRDKDLKVAKAQNDARIRKILRLAHEAGVADKDIQTSELRMESYFSDEKVPRFLGYEVSEGIFVTLKDLSKYDSLMTKLLEGGMNRVNGIYFDIAETRKHRDEARSNAIRAAKEKAVAMASELGQTVGKPWEIAEEGGWDSSQYMANSVLGGATREYENDKERREPTMAAGQITIRASVRVSFQLE